MAVRGSPVAASEGDRLLHSPPSWFIGRGMNEYQEIQECLQEVKELTINTNSGFSNS